MPPTDSPAIPVELVGRVLARLDTLHGELDAAANPHRMALRHLGLTDAFSGARTPYHQDAFAIWSDLRRRNPSDWESAHHLAIMHHARAFDLEFGAHPEESDVDWAAAMELWYRLWQADGFWEGKAASTASRVGPGIWRALREQLPTLLLTLHYDIAFDAAQARVHRAKYHLGLVHAAPYPSDAKEAVALAGAGALAWFTSSRLARRLNDLATSARRYAAGDLSQPAYHYEDDQVGTVARALDGIVRELVGRVRELAADRARIEAILSGMVEGVVVVSDDGRVQSVNRAALAMLGLADAAVGSHYLEAVRNSAVAALVTGALNGEQPAGLEISPGESSASRLVARAAPVPGAGNGAVLVLHDITDLRRADQVRRDFVTNVSHELRTPLTAIRGYAEALADDPQSPEDRARFIDVIARHAGRMERLVRDLLRLASLDARQEVVEACPVRLDELLEDVAADLEPMLDARRQRVELRVDPRVATITTDASKLQAALRNLVENAVNYSPEGRLIELDASAQGDVVALRVSDQGPGVPEADLERIFERFYRVDKARSRESGGTGLGLSIVKHLVELLGGRVWASNRPEGGATFTITLPLDAAGG